jgi:hypothetical protein
MRRVIWGSEHDLNLMPESALPTHDAPDLLNGKRENMPGDYPEWPVPNLSPCAGNPHISIDHELGERPTMASKLSRSAEAYWLS